jgi:hypothetical protein
VRSSIISSGWSCWNATRCLQTPLTGPGTPQSRHIHALLAGGQRALDKLFPSFEQELARGGAVPLRVALDVRIEMPGYDPFPPRDLGFVSYSMSRPLIELVVRRRVERHANITLRPRCRVRDLVPSADHAAVIAVCFENADGKSETLPADLVVDAPGRGNVTLGLLESIGQPMPEETVIGVDIGYATAVFVVPDDAPSDWKAMRTVPNIRESTRGGLMLPLEGARWMVTIGGRHGDKPPGVGFRHLRGSCGPRPFTTRSGTPNASATSSASAFREAFGGTSSGSKHSRAGCFHSATRSAASTPCVVKT